MEFDRAAPLFDRRIPVKIQDTVHDSMVFRILLGKRHSEQIYRFELSDDKDPFFYYFYDLTEKNFPQFKSDEKLLVDFHQYPHKVIQLLEFCLLSTAQADGVITSSPPFTSSSATAIIASVNDQISTNENYFSSVSSSGKILDFFHHFIEGIPSSGNPSASSDVHTLTKNLKNFEEVSSKINDLIKVNKSAKTDQDSSVLSEKQEEDLDDDDLNNFEKEFSFFNFDDISLNFSEDKLFFSENELEEESNEENFDQEPSDNENQVEEAEEVNSSSTNHSFASTSSSDSSASAPSPFDSSSTSNSPSHCLNSSKLPSLPSYSHSNSSTLILPPGVTYYAKFNENLNTFEVLQKNVFNIMKTINLRLNKASEQDLKYYLLSQISFINTKNKQLSSSFKQLFSSSSGLNECLNHLYVKINNSFMHDSIQKKKYLLFLKNYLINKKFHITKLFNNVKKVFFLNIQKLKDYNKAMVANYKQKLDAKDKQLQDLQRAYSLLEKENNDLKNSKLMLENNERNLTKKNHYLVVNNNLLTKKNNKRLVYFNKNKKFYEKLLKNNKKYRKIIKRLSSHNKSTLKATANVNNVLKYKDYLINKLYVLLNYYKNNIIKNLVDKNYANLKKINELNSLIETLKKNGASLINNINTNKVNIQKLNNFIQELLKKLFNLKNTHSTLNNNYKNLLDQLAVANQTLEKNKETISYLCSEINKWETGGITMTSFSPNLTQSEMHLPHSASNLSNISGLKSSLYNAAAASGTAATLSVNNSINFSDYFNDTTSLNQETFSTLSSSAIPLNAITSVPSSVPNHTPSDSHNYTPDRTNSTVQSSSYTRSVTKTSVSSKEKSSRVSSHQNTSALDNSNTLSSPSTASTSFPSKLGVTSNKVVQKYLEEIPPPNPVSFTASTNKARINKSSSPQTPSSVFPLADIDDLPYYSVTN